MDTALCVIWFCVIKFGVWLPDLLALWCVIAVACDPEKTGLEQGDDVTQYQAADAR